MLQLKDRVIRLQKVSYAQISFPDENTANDWIELLLIVDGHDVILTGDEALLLWTALCKNSIALAPPEPIEEGDRLPVVEDDVITAAYGIPTR